MEEFSFEAIGTQWKLLSDGKIFSVEVQKKILSRVAYFEEQFSRFKAASEVNAFREATAGEYSITSEFHVLLSRALKLRLLTNGVYDPASAVILEHLGYDQEYSFVAKSVPVPMIYNWQLAGQNLVLEGPTVFDFGGIGKGYCIDMIADLLKVEGFEFFLVDGGGDMYATSKADGGAYRVALEWPGKPALAFGTVELQYQGLAVSDSLRRRFGKHHHIVDAKTRKNTKSVVGAVALGQNAWDADCATAALMQWPNTEIPQVEKEFRVQTIIITKKAGFLVSPRWSGEIFSVD